MDSASILKIIFFWCLMVFYNIQVTICQAPALPLIITLPISVRTNPPNNNDGSEEERYGQQTMVKNTFDSTGQNEYHQEDNEEDSGNQPNFHPSFLSFNPSNKVMLLQISDFISATTQDQQEPSADYLPEVEDSEEDHTYQDTTLSTKRNPSWQNQEFYDFEDYVRRLENRRRPKKSKKTSKRRIPRPDSVEDVDDGVYGSDPVVHFLRNRRKEIERGFHFGHMPADDDKFKLEDWWTY